MVKDEGKPPKVRVVAKEEKGKTTVIAEGTDPDAVFAVAEAVRSAAAHKARNKAK